MQEKAWFTVGEEKGDEDKAGEMRAQIVAWLVIWNTLKSFILPGYFS